MRSILAFKRVARRKRFVSVQNHIHFRREFRDDGQALVETAVVLPVVLTIATGILIFGIFIMQIMSLGEGVSNAGRVISVKAGQTLDPCADVATAVQSAAPLLSSGSLSYSITLTPPGGSATTYTGSTCTSAPANLQSGGTVSITAKYATCSLLFYGNNLMPNGCSITKTITEAVQ